MIITTLLLPLGHISNRNDSDTFRKHSFSLRNHSDNLRNYFLTSRNLSDIHRNPSGVTPIHSLKLRNYPKRHPTLSVLPDGSETCRHDRDTSPINDHQRDLDTHDEPYTLHDYHMIDWTKTSYSVPLSRDTLLVRDPIVGITIPSSISLPTSTLYSFHNMTSLVT